MTITDKTITIKPIILILIIATYFHLLFAKQLTYAVVEDSDENEEEENEPQSPPAPPQPPPVVVCQSPIDLTVDSSWLETTVFGDFRIWHIMFSALGILTVVAVLLCCLFRCRIPRTKQEIEADYTRRKITKLINAHLRKIKLEELEYDPTNLLPVLKRVEELEDNRVKKHRSFEMRRLNWRQKIKRLFSKKDMSFEDEFGMDDQKGIGDGIVMTKEEMDKIEKEVEDAKIDTTAFNVITDQIAILSYFESDKTRKKRQKEEKKKQKQAEKEQKKKDKEDKKKEVIKTTDREKSKEKSMLELKASELEKNLKKSDDDVILDMKKTETDGDKPSKPLFSFRSTVRGLMSGLRVGGRASPSIEEQPEPETKSPSPPTTEPSVPGKVEPLIIQKVQQRTPSPESKSPVREEIIINIGLVRKEFENIPQIEVQEDKEEQEPEDEKKNVKSKWFRLHQKSRKPILRMDAIVDRNRLQIPEMPIKDINVSRDKTKSKSSKSKESSSSSKESKKKWDSKLSKVSEDSLDKYESKELESETMDKKTTLKKKDRILKSSATIVLVDDSKSTKMKSKKEESTDQKKKPETAKNLKDSKTTQAKQSKDKMKKTKDVEPKTEQKKLKNTFKVDKPETDSKTHLKKVLIMEPFEKPGSTKKLFARESSDSRILESIEEEQTQDTLKSIKKSKKTQELGKLESSNLSIEKQRQQQEEFAKRFSEHKRKLRSEAGIKKQLTTSSSEIEIPVEHVYRHHQHRDHDRESIGSGVEIQVHHLSPMIPSSVSTSMMVPFRQQRPTSPPPIAEHMETVEKYLAQSPTGNEQRKLIIEKTRNVIFDQPSTSASASGFPSKKPEEKPKKKKKVKLIETTPPVPELELIEDPVPPTTEPKKILGRKKEKSSKTSRHK